MLSFSTFPIFSLNLFHHKCTLAGTFTSMLLLYISIYPWLFPEASSFKPSDWVWAESSSQILYRLVRLEGDCSSALCTVCFGAQVQTRTGSFKDAQTWRLSSVALALCLARSCSSCLRLCALAVGFLPGSMSLHFSSVILTKPRVSAREIRCSQNNPAWKRCSADVERFLVFLRCRSEQIFPLLNKPNTDVAVYIWHFKRKLIMLEQITPRKSLDNLLPLTALVSFNSSRCSSRKWNLTLLRSVTHAKLLFGFISDLGKRSHILAEYNLSCLRLEQQTLSLTEMICHPFAHTVFWKDHTSLPDRAGQLEISQLHCYWPMDSTAKQIHSESLPIFN